MSPHPSMTPHNRWTFKRHLLLRNTQIGHPQIRNPFKIPPIPGRQISSPTDQSSKPLVLLSVSSGWASSAIPTKSISCRRSRKILRPQIRRHRSNVPPVLIADPLRFQAQSLTPRNSRRKPNEWQKRQRNRNALWQRRCTGSRPEPLCGRGMPCRPLARIWSGNMPSIQIPLKGWMTSLREPALGQRGERTVPTRRGKGVRLLSLLLEGGGMEKHHFPVGEMNGVQSLGGENGTMITLCHLQTWVGCPLSLSPQWIAIPDHFDYGQERARSSCISLPRRHCGRRTKNSPNLRGRRIRCRTSNGCLMTYTYDLPWTLVPRCRTTDRHLLCRISQ